jgi:hypothetical protein
LAFEIRDAERRQAKLRLGIGGTAGSGKTASALLLAYGICKDWRKIGLIDTENGSGELYVGSDLGGVKIGVYRYGRIESPYKPQKYVDAIHAFENAGVSIIIIDSLTHAWAGEGGLLDEQGRLTDMDRFKNSYAAWRQITPQHNALVEAMLQSKCHVIATMRSKTEYAQEKGDDGKTKVKKLGMAVIQRDGMDYEFTVMLDIGSDHIATSGKDRTQLFDGRYFKPGVKDGELLLGWLETGADTPAPETLRQPDPEPEQPPPKPPAEKTINDAQVKRLYTVASANGWTHEQVKATLAASKGKYASSKDIPVAKYDAVVGFFEANKPPAPPEPAPTTEGGSADA